MDAISDSQTALALQKDRALMSPTMTLPSNGVTPVGGALPERQLRVLEIGEDDGRTWTYWRHQHTPKPILIRKERRITETVVKREGGADVWES